MEPVSVEMGSRGAETRLISYLVLDRLGHGFPISAHGGQCKRSLKIIRNNELKRLETGILHNEKLDLKKKFKILEALYNEAVALGVFPLKDPLEGLEVDIRIAKVVNSVSKDT